MIRVVLPGHASYAAWRDEALGMLRAGQPPERLEWSDGAPSLFDVAPSRISHGTAERHNTVTDTRAAPLHVPRGFVELATDAVAHADPQRYSRLYRLLWRIVHGERALMRVASDVDVMFVATLAKAVRREAHKAKAFVRFREVATDDRPPVYIAWFESEHAILGLVAPFFVKRFAGMRWSILTPTASAHWNGERCTFGPGATLADAAHEDAVESLWRTYYANIFNPARLNEKMMRREMPQRYWRNLPEAQLIPSLTTGAASAVVAMVERGPTTPRKPIRAPVFAAAPEPAPETLEAIHAGVRACRGCPLWRPATQAVPGEGAVAARTILIGEQPGDEEDLSGRPFIGPSGRLLDRALEEAGLARDALYLTKAVKHFKFKPRGKVRLHARANAAEQAACRHWLAAEIERLAPTYIVCLGATAAHAIFGRTFALMRERGRWNELAGGAHAIATVHPSYLLRLQDADERARAWAAFVSDLREVAQRPDWR